MLMKFFRRKAVVLLTVVGISAPFIGMKLVDFYYYSSIIGCAAGFLSLHPCSHHRDEKARSRKKQRKVKLDP